MKVRLQVAVAVLIAAGASAGLAGPVAALTAPKPAATASVAAGTAASGRTLVRCGNGTAAYKRCVAARNRLIHERVRVSPLQHNVPDCTAPGCVGGWFFYYYP